MMKNNRNIHFISPRILMASSLLLAGCVSYQGENFKNQTAQPAEQQKIVRNDIVSSGNAAIDQQANAFRDVQYWAQVYQSNPSDLNAILSYAKALSLIGSDTQATKVLADGAQKYPQNAEILRQHALLLAKKDLPGPALRKLKVAQKYAPHDWRIHNDMGKMNGKLGEHRLAIANFNYGLNLSPNNPQIHSNLGLTYIIIKDLPKAEFHLRTATQSPHATPKMRNNYGLALGLQGKYDQARSVFLQDQTVAEANRMVEQFKKMHINK